MTKSKPFLSKVHRIVHSLFPSCPVLHKGNIITRVSQRVEKETQRFNIEGEKFVRTIAIAYIRHRFTDYDKMNNISKEDARVAVSKRVKEVINSWQK